MPPNSQVWGWVLAALVAALPGEPREAARTGGAPGKAPCTPVGSGHPAGATAAPGPQLTNNRAAWGAPRISQTPRSRATHPAATPEDTPPKKPGAMSPIFPAPDSLVPPFSRPLLLQGCWWGPVPQCPQQDRGTWPPPPKAWEKRGQGQTSPSGLVGQERRHSLGKPRRGTLEPARSLAPAWQTHQLEDVLVLGHDGELQHIVTAGRGDRGVRVAGVGPRLPPERPISCSAGSLRRGRMSPSPRDGHAAACSQPPAAPLPASTQVTHRSCCPSDTQGDSACCDVSPSCHLPGSARPCAPPSPRKGTHLFWISAMTCE